MLVSVFFDGKSSSYQAAIIAIIVDLDASDHERAALIVRQQDIRRFGLVLRLLTIIETPFPYDLRNTISLPPSSDIRTMRSVDVVTGLKTRIKTCKVDLLLPVTFFKLRKSTTQLSI